MPNDVQEGTEETVPGQPPFRPLPVTASAPGSPPMAPGQPRFMPPPIPQAAPRPSGFDSPAYQRQIEAEQLRIASQAKNVQQAEKDVSSARRMLGILKADREIASGTPPDKAIYQNLHLLTTPGTAPATSAYRTMAPIPKPYATTFQAGTNQVPAVITPGLGGAQHTQFIPRSALPQPEFKASVEQIAPGVSAIKLGPNHYQLLERPNVKGTPSHLEQVQQAIWKSDLAALQKAKAKTPIPERQAEYQTQIDKIERKMLESARAGTAPPAASPESPASRVTVTKGGKKFSLPRSQLEEAIKQGYSEAK